MPRKPSTPVVPKHQQGRKAMKRTFSLYDSTVAQLEAIRDEHGLRSLSAAIGFAANLAVRKKSRLPT
jgi:hypothetical protein